MKVDEPSDEFWVLVANVAPTRIYKNPLTEKPQLRRGTKHFKPGTLVYVADRVGGALWKHEFCRAQVIGRHRKSSKWIRVTMNVGWLYNFREKRVYSPRLLERLHSKYDYPFTPASGWHVETIAEANQNERRLRDLQQLRIMDEES